MYIKEEYIDNEYMQMDLLRFTTAGSVDDGKSTLIGRLLLDSKSIFEDQLEAIRLSSEKRGDGYLNLALLTDGLKAEREQGITIDVAYRYFATPKRKFIIADTPGHIEYTRNMVTGASTANLAIILVDARHGIVEQTHRHLFIASLLQIKHIILCVNKMDLVDYKESVFKKIQKQFAEFSSKLSIPDIQYIPISALNGDNVVKKSSRMLWYKGATLLHTLENVNVGADFNHIDSRFPIQCVIQTNKAPFENYKGLAGKIESGIFKPGDDVCVLPSGYMTSIKTIETIDGQKNIAFAPMSITMTLEDDFEIKRGDMIVKPYNIPRVSQDMDTMICWLTAEENLKTGKKYILKHTTKETKCVIKAVRYKIDINTLNRVKEDYNIAHNEIGRIRIRTSDPLFYDNYNKNRHIGSFILIDEQTHETVAAGMLL